MKRTKKQPDFRPMEDTTCNMCGASSEVVGRFSYSTDTAGINMNLCPDCLRSMASALGLGDMLRNATKSVTTP